MRIRLLGPFEIDVAGSPVEIPGYRERVLLARLALSPGTTLSVDLLIDALWGEALPAKPTNALQAAVSRLRKAIGKGAIETRAPGYVLAVPADSVDIFEFAAAAVRAEAAAEDDERAATARRALELWRGPALSDFADEEFAQAEIRRLSELHDRAVELRIEADIAAGRHASVIAELERLISDNPLRESLRRLHMLALYRAGRQVDALRVYQVTRQLLADELGIDPGPSLQALELQILEHAPDIALPEPGLAGGRERPHNLPPRLTSFIGRSAETVAVGAVLESSRMVTLLGPGGAGKTSLAIEVGRERLGQYRHGVWLVELAAAGSDEIADVVAAALGVDTGPGFSLAATEGEDPASQVIAALRDRHALVILDNCEHVIAAAADLAQTVLLDCPQIDVLTTSRERLGVPGEAVHKVPPLDIGRPGEATPAVLLAADAVRLFGERARAVNPSFVLDEANAVDVATICRRLDGMPLAIELAAARISSLPPSEIAVRLDDVFRLLTGGARTAIERHQTLRATIGWSYALLASGDRGLFVSLSAFRGHFDLAAAAAVADMGEPELLDALQRLVDQSMVIAEPADQPRYRLLETLRAFGAEQLDTSDSHGLTKRRHFDHYRAIGRESEKHLRTGEQMKWLERLDACIENIRAALDWSAEHDPVAGVGMAGELGWYSYLRGHRAEWRARITRLLDAGGREAPPLDLGKALFAYAMADPSPLRAAEDLEAAREQFDIAGAKWNSAVSGATANIYRSFGGDMTAAKKEIDRAWDVMVELDDDWGRGLLEFYKANAAIGANDFDGVTDHAARAQQWFARTGDSWGIGYMVYFRGLTERARGHYAAAQATLNDALSRARVLGLQAEIPVMLGELANIATLQGDYAVADEALNEAATIGEATPFLGSQAMIYNARGLWWRHQGRPRQALELHRKASAAYAAADQHNGVAYAEGSAGRSALAIGDLIAARRHQLRSLEAALAMTDWPGVAFAAEGMAGVAMAAGSAHHGARLLGAASALRQRVGLPLPHGEDFDVRRWALQGGEDLGSAAYDAAFREGTEFDLDQTVAAAREDIAGLLSR